METDELYAIWNAYLQTDFGGYDPLRQNFHPTKIAIRLTPVEIHKLVEVIFERLLTDEGHEVVGK
jgi:hypothetical protein